MLAVRWYLRYGLSYRDVEELLVERGVEVDHITIYRWVQRFTPLILEEARPCRHSVGDRWFVDETYVGVAGVWRYVYRAVDQHGQVIDVLVSNRRNIAAATSFFETILIGRDRPREVTTDLAAPLLRVIDELLPDAQHDTTQYANNRIEWDHGRLKARLRPMRGLRTDRTATAVTGVMRSSRTYDAATTNSASKHAKSIYWSRQPSTNSPQQSELRSRQRAALSRPSIDQRNSALGDRPAIPPDHGVVDVGGVTGPAPADARTRSPKRWTVIDSDCSRT
jgi:IS6 family transposase